MISLILSFLLVLTSASSSKTSPFSDGKIINFPDEKDKYFNCTRVDDANPGFKVVCKCISEKFAVHLNELDLRRKINPKDIETTRLELQTCNFTLDTNFTNFLKNLTTLIIEKGGVQKFHQHSLNVSNIALRHLTHPLNLNKATSVIFGPAVERLTLRNVTLIDFSTNAFLGMNSKSEVFVFQSTIKPYQDNDINQQPLKSLVFRDVNFHRSYTTFINVNANSVSFANCSMSLDDEDSMVIVSNEVKFQNSTLMLDSPNPLNITTSNFEMDGCILDQPQQKSFEGLTPFDEKSTLKFSNIAMTDPAKGTFLTKFLNVVFKNITLHDGCYCNTVMHMACSSPNDLTYSRGSLLPTLTCDELTSLLVNQTFCRSKTNEFLPVTSKEVCPTFSRLSAGSAAVVSILIGILVIVIIISVVFCYRGHLKSKEKENLIRKWRMAYPATTVYRSPELVSIDLEQNKYYSRPASLMIVDPGSPVESHENQPDLIQSLGTQDTNEVEADIPQDSKFNFLRKSSVMRKKSGNRFTIHF